MSETLSVFYNTGITLFQYFCYARNDGEGSSIERYFKQDEAFYVNSDIEHWDQMVRVRDNLEKQILPLAK